MSPLRYPGAKRRLSAFIADTLRLNGIRPKLFVEPFAGGASVSLELLNRGLVDSIALGERDPLVASFWRTVFFDTNWLLEAIKTVTISLDQWDYYRNTYFRSHRDRALACLFLNRTSFSGILAKTAGPLGGRAQKSEHNLGCRFPRERLAKRIRQAAALKDKVSFVKQGNYSVTISKAQALYAPEEVFFYLDPPFFQKADRLYRFSFDQKGHQTLHDQLDTLTSPWLLSYDPAPEIVTMYKGGDKQPRHVDLLYSASKKAELAVARELIISSLAKLPTKTQLFRSKTGLVPSGGGPRTSDRRLQPVI